MRQDAIKAAEEALVTASQAYERIRTAKSHADTTDAWIEFLHAFQRIVNKLGAGAKGHPPSWQWHCGVVQQRKDDTRLQYVHQARHADEHGIEPLGQEDSTGYIHENAGFIHIDGRDIPITHTPRSTYLAPVTNRNVTYYPPQSPFPPPIYPGHDPRTPGNVAYTVLPVLSGWINEAKALPTH